MITRRFFLVGVGASAAALAVARVVNLPPPVVTQIRVEGARRYSHLALMPSHGVADRVLIKRASSQRTIFEWPAAREASYHWNSTQPLTDIVMPRDDCLIIEVGRDLDCDLGFIFKDERGRAASEWIQTKGGVVVKRSLNYLDVADA